MNKRLRNIILSICIISLIFILTACGSKDKAPQTVSLVDQVKALETSLQDTNQTLAQVSAKVDGKTINDYSFSATKTGIHVVMPSGNTKVAFKIYLIPSNLNIGKVGDSYEFALKSLFNNPPINIKPFNVELNSVNNQWQISEISFITPPYILIKQSTTADINFTLSVPYKANIEILQSVN